MIEIFYLGSEMNCLLSHEMLRFSISFPFAHTYVCVHSRRHTGASAYSKLLIHM